MILAMLTAKERRAVADVRHAIKAIGMTAILETMREHCDEQASSATVEAQNSYGQIEEALDEARGKIVAITATEVRA